MTLEKPPNKDNHGARSQVRLTIFLSVDWSFELDKETLSVTIHTGVQQYVRWPRIHRQIRAV
jgi:hypothetical protein